MFAGVTSDFVKGNFPFCSTRKGYAASVSTGAGRRARESRRQRNRGKIRAGSPDEETALVEHLKGMSLTAGAIREIRSLLVCLLMLGEVEPARKLQRMVENFQLSQTATVKLAEETSSTSVVDEQEQTLERNKKIGGFFMALQSVYFTQRSGKCHCVLWGLRLLFYARFEVEIIEKSTMRQRIYIF